MRNSHFVVVVARQKDKPTKKYIKEQQEMFRGTNKELLVIFNTQEPTTLKEYAKAFEAHEDFLLDNSLPCYSAPNLRLFCYHDREGLKKALG